jgi:hypothetical protein
MNVNQVILDYVAMCEEFGPLGFDEFVDLWLEADALARESAEIRSSMRKRGAESRKVAAGRASRTRINTVQIST